MLSSQQAKANLSAGYDAMPEADASVDVVARTIWGEARREGATGMQAVACVIANRVAAPGWWPSSLCRGRAVSAMLDAYPTSPYIQMSHNVYYGDNV